MKENKCVDECGFAYFEIDRKCQKCHESCSECSEADEHSCIVCANRDHLL